MLPGTERNANTGVLMFWNGTLANITHMLCSLRTLTSQHNTSFAQYDCKVALYEEHYKSNSELTTDFSLSSTERFSSQLAD